MARLLRAAVIGLGVGRKHAEAYAAHPGTVLHAVCDMDESVRSEVAASMPSVAMHASDSNIIEDPDVDLISIASYDEAHHGQICRALRAGKHVFVEKPLCLTRKEAEEIRALLTARPALRLSSNLNLRTEPRFLDLRDRIRAGRLGRVYAAEGDYLWGRVHKLTDGWRRHTENYSIILGAALHMVDLLCWLLRDFRVDTVHAVGNRIATHSSELPFNDYSLVSMQFVSGVIAKVTGNAGSVAPHFHRVAIYGTEATFVHELTGSGIFTSRDPAVAPTTLKAAYPGARKSEILGSFIDAICGEGVPVVSADDVFSVTSICLAAEESMRAGQRVRVRAI